MKKNIFTVLIVLALLLVIKISFGKPIPASRYHFLMDHNWKFTLGDKELAKNTDFNDNDWRSVDLPHDWSIEGEFDKDAPTGGGGGYLPTGIGWYRKTFKMPVSAKDKQVSIQFDGIYQNSEVWINGHYLGKRPNGYISFVYDLTPYLKSDKNIIAVRVDNSQQPNSRWYSGSGIYRHVWLNITNNLHVAQWGTYITTPVATPQGATIAVKTQVENTVQTTGKATLIADVLDASGKQVSTNRTEFSVSDKGTTDVAMQLTVQEPALWSLEHPYMYTLRTTIQQGSKTVDEYSQPFGIRNIQYNNTDGFLLNGKRVKMNGVCLHHDAGCVGAAVPIKIWQQRLARLKEMGCNAIRTSHNPPAPEFLDLCDKMGFLVMDESFDVWEGGKAKSDYHLYFKDWHEKDLIAHIHRDWNHPSVVMWSAGNEIHDQSSARGTEVLKELLAIFHKEDNTRPVTTGSDEIAADGHSTRMDFLEAEDIVGYNYVDRWHERRELFYDADRPDHPNWKVVGTESESMRSVADYSLGMDPKRVNANYLAGIVRSEQLWKFVAVHNYVIGDFMWTGIDYLGEARWPGKGASSGVIDMTNKPKDAFYFYQSQWTTKPVLHLFPHWDWAGREGQVMPVVAYTNCDTVELFVNGKSYGMKMQEFPRQGNSGGWNRYAKTPVAANTADLHLTWDVVYEPGIIKAVGRKNGKEVIIDEIHTTGKPASLRISADTAQINTDGANNIALINVDVLDEKGNVVSAADNLINFKIQGSGKLIGVDNGNQRDTHSFKIAQRNAWKGHAYGVVQSTNTPGDIIITVQADGLREASVKINTSKSTMAEMAAIN
ncbi:MAG: sugar-binding domain-containing protein [Bacteroidota bacterium]